MAGFPVYGFVEIIRSFETRFIDRAHLRHIPRLRLEAVERDLCAIVLISGQRELVGIGFAVVKVLRLGVVGHDLAEERAIDRCLKVTDCL